MADEALQPASANPFDALAENDNIPAVAPAAQTAANPFDSIGPDIGEESSATGSFGRAAARATLPSIAAFPAMGAGAQAGAAVGAIAGPVGAVAGGLVGALAGGFGAGYVANAAQDWAISKLPDSWQEAIGQDERQRKMDEQQHGTAAFLGGLLPTVLTMKPGLPAKAGLRENATAFERIMAYPATAAVFGGGVMGGMELAQQAAGEQPINWTHVAVATGVGVVFNRTTRFGERLIESGARPTRRALGQPEPTEAGVEAAPEAVDPSAPAAPDAPMAAPEAPGRPVTARDWNEAILGQKEAPTVLEAGDAKVVGPGVTESVFMGTQDQAPSAAMSAQQSVRNERLAMGESPIADVHQSARAMEPEVFAAYEDLQAQQADLRRWIAEAEEMGGAPAAKAALARIDAKLEAMSPQIAAAYRRGAEAKGGEFVENVPRETIVSPADLLDQRNFIAQDVTEKLIGAGRPAEEAAALGQLTAARYETRAGRLGLEARDLYLREGPEIAGADGKIIKTMTPERERTDLTRLLNERGTPAQIAEHPVVKEATAYNDSRPRTTELPGYGTPEFKANREFNFNGEKVKGYDQAVERLAKDAEAYSSNGPIKRDREAVLVWGPPAAGKSSFSERLAKEKRAAIVDPDDAKKAIPEFEGGRAANSVHQESSEISGEVLKKMVQKGANLVLPRVGHDLERMRAFVAALKDQGYRVSVVNMSVEPGEAYRRMIRRFLKTGRVIGSDYFSGVGTKPRENYYALKKEGLFNEGIDIDANGPVGQERVIDAPDSKLAAEMGFGQRDAGSGLEGAAEPAAAKAETVAAEPVQAAYEAVEKIDTLTPAEQKRDLPKFTPARDGDLPHPGPDKPAGVFMFDPMAIDVDAKRFQFKSGGDEYGVTGALRGVQKWDPAKAQAIIVWEQNDGKLFVADGHQRAGLAKRLTSEGKAKAIELPGVLYREVDGISADDIRAIAAVTNIANGSGSALDGAKVLRARPDLMDASLPLTAGKGQQAAALARLGDEAFRMVVNDVVPEHFGAVVAEIIPTDHARQVAALKAIAKFEPRNAEEAAVLTQRVAAAELAKREEGAQASMFGDMEAPESTAGEEMKIVGRVIRDLKKDKSLFGRVVANAGRLEETGSQIARDAAKTVMTDAEIFAKTLATDAYAAGPIRTELVAVAKDLKDGRVTLGEATDRILTAVRGQAETNGLDRAGARGRLGESEKEFAQSKELEFEPGAEGKPQALIPGVEPVAPKTTRDLIQERAAAPLRGKNAGAKEGDLFDFEGQAQKELFQSDDTISRDNDSAPYIEKHFPTKEKAVDEFTKLEDWIDETYDRADWPQLNALRDAIPEWRERVENGAPWKTGPARDILDLTEWLHYDKAGADVPDVIDNLLAIAGRHISKPKERSLPEIGFDSDVLQEANSLKKKYGGSTDKLNELHDASKIVEDKNFADEHISSKEIDYLKTLVAESKKEIDDLRVREDAWKNRNDDDYERGYALDSDDIAESLVSFEKTLSEAKAAIAEQETSYGSARSWEKYFPPSSKELEQTARGKVRIAEGRKPIVTLMKDANASTFVHESGHIYLEELMRDAMHERAPNVLRDDADTVLGWLGAKSAEDIKTKHHEKFARGFEQYLREGVAPSKELAGVFARFKDWLLQIYESLKGLGAPINEDIKGVFDRMLAMEPQRTVIAAEREPGGPTIHDIHETEAREISTPAEAAPKADQVAAEANRFATELTPEVKNELETKIAQLETELGELKGRSDAGTKPGGEAGAGAGEAGPLEPGSGKPGALSGSIEGGAEPGAVGEGGGGATAESARPADVDTGNPLAPKPAGLFGPEQSPFIDKAGNIRLDTLTNLEDARQAIRDAAAANQDFIGDRRGVVTDGQVMDLARAAGMEGAERLVKNRVAGQAFSAEEVMTLRLALVQSATEVSASMKKAANGTDADVMAYAHAKERHHLLQGTVAAATAEAGRALRAFRDITGMTGEAKSADLFMREATGKTLFQLRQEARLGATLDTPEAVSKFMTDSRKRGFGRMMLEYWINGLLSGPATHTTAALGTTILSLQHHVAESSVAALIGAARKALGREGEIVRFGEVGARLKGAAQGLPTALKSGGESFMAGTNTLLPGETPHSQAFQMGHENAPRPQMDTAATYHSIIGDAFAAVQGMRDGLMATGAIIKAGGEAGAPLIGAQYSLSGAIPDIAVKGVNVLPLGTAARLPGRLLTTADSFFRATNYSMELNARAYRTASEEGLTGTKFDARVAEIRSNPSEALMEEIVESAQRLSVMESGGKFLQALTHLSNIEIGGFPALKFIMPFVRVAGNILRQTVVERSPVAFLSPELRADLMGKNGTVAADTAAARVLVGTVTAITVGMMAAEGYMSGSGPTDPKEAAMWRLAGNQAHSVRIGDTWYGVEKLGPIGMLMSIAADMYEVGKHASDGEMEEAAGKTIHAFSQNIIDQSMMKGVSDLLRAVTDSDRYGSQYVRNFLSAFVPYSVGMAQLAKTSDPYTNQARTVVDAVRAKIPGHLDSYFENPLFPKRDIWGEPMTGVKRTAGGFLGIAQKDMSTDPVNVAMIDLGISPGNVTRKIRGVELTDAQFDDFARLAGRMTKQRLDVIVNSPDWRTWPNYAKTLVVEETVKQSREVARGLMMGKYPSIARDATEAKLEKFKD